jgi:hypothetical protein
MQASLRQSTLGIRAEQQEICSTNSWITFSCGARMLSTQSALLFALKSHVVFITNAYVSLLHFPRSGLTVVVFIPGDGQSGTTE